MTGKIREILKYPDPKLLVRSTEVAVFDDSLRDLALDLFETSVNVPWGKAVGLAAPQIGVNLRVFIANNQVFVNPEITHYSSERRMQLEGCYSLEDNRFSYRVSRARFIDLTWQDLSGRPHKKRFSRADAQVIQHGYDHLEGRLCCG
jgi:peptide deformylase